MRGKSLKILAVLVIAVLAAAAAAQAQGREHPGHAGHRHGDGPGALGPMMELLHSLELTPEQRDQIHAVVEQRMQNGLRAALEAERDARRSVHKLIHDPAATDDQIIDAVRAGAAEEERLALEKRRLFEGLQGILTDEQKQELREGIEQMPKPRMRRGRPSGD